jgi:hypothetical protein
MQKLTTTIATIGLLLAPLCAAAATTLAVPANPEVSTTVADRPARPDLDLTVLEHQTSAAPKHAAGQAIDMRDDTYDSSYVFGMTKGVANSTMAPALKPLVFLVTVPLDIALLPFAAIGGFF